MLSTYAVNVKGEEASTLNAAELFPPMAVRPLHCCSRTVVGFFCMMCSPVGYHLSCVRPWDVFDDVRDNMGSIGI